ncbi:coiled-coil domain-containing protein 60-like [Hoplias malabaricus]|uniref:coiled-coil domain-containing protein 60-like n=1 Tax=Hoplias malabaricus TaxID=27720 RepID=UPI0034624C3E
MAITPTATRRYTGSARVREHVIQNKESWERVYWETLGQSHREKSQLGYRVEKAPKAGISESEDVDGGLCHASPVDISRGNKVLLVKNLTTGRRVDTDSLWKYLWKSRNLVLAVKQGCSYFHLLQGLEEQEKQQREKMMREERKKRAIRPPSNSSDSDTDRETERMSLNAGMPSCWKQSRKRRVQSARPFTPIHQSLTSHQPQQLASEHVYRQLCCLCWLLETLTLENSERVGSVISCWDVKDPGSSRNTLKTLNKEKAIEAKWEQFISPPKSMHPVLKVSRVCLSRKAPSLSVPSSVAVTSSLSSGLSSLVQDAKDPGDVNMSSEDGECSSETDPPVSEYLQKLLEEVHKSVAKELYGTSEMGGNIKPDRDESLRCDPSGLDSAVTGKVDMQRPKSSPTRRLATTTFSHRKAAMLGEIRQAFEDRAEELALSLTDTLERNAKRRWRSGVQRYQFLSKMSPHRSLSSPVCSVTQSELQSENSDTPERPYSTQWLSVLLRSLPSHVILDRKMMSVLEKLKRFTAERTLRVRPHVFLQVLGSLQPWELCWPDLCVAIEIVRQYAVRISTEEYDFWLRTRVNLPQTKHSIKTRK